MELDYGFTDLLLTSHAGLPAFSHVLKAARLPALFGPSLKTIPDSAIYTTHIALLALGKTDFEAVNAYRDDRAFVRLLGLGAAAVGGNPAPASGSAGPADSLTPLSTKPASGSNLTASTSKKGLRLAT